MKKVIFLLSLICLLAQGGTNTLTTQTPGTVIRAAHVNQFETALENDVTPRNTSGVPTTLLGSLGTSTLEWLKGFIASGYWDAGDLKYHMDFSGATPIGQGWYPCDGTTINGTNYNVLHGAGSWDTYVTSSPLDGNSCGTTDSIYLVGETTLSEHGDFVGNVSHQIDVSHIHTGLDHVHNMNSHTHTGPDHSHVGPSHNHQWNNFINTSTTSQSFDSGGSALNMSITTAVSGTHISATNAATGIISADFYTNNSGTGSTGNAGTGATGGPNNSNTLSTAPGMNSSLSSTQSIQPRSMKAGIYIRVIN